jgi:hypothetical protein
MFNNVKFFYYFLVNLILCILLPLSHKLLLFHYCNPFLLLYYLVLHLVVWSQLVKDVIFFVLVIHLHLLCLFCLFFFTKVYGFLDLLFFEVPLPPYWVELVHVFFLNKMLHPVLFGLHLHLFFVFLLEWHHFFRSLLRFVNLLPSLHFFLF